LGYQVASSGRSVNAFSSTIPRNLVIKEPPTPWIEEFENEIDAE
jgi:hypothetical protein